MISRFLTRVRGHLQLLARWKSSAGLFEAIRWEVLRLSVKLGFPEPALWHAHPNQVLHPLQARLGRSSDMLVFDQIFLFEEYACLLDLKESALVLDLGANVGYSAAYFLSVFPKARVVAVEPDDRNIEVCRVNLSPYKDRALVLHGAAWSRSTTLQFVEGTFGDGREWATRVDEAIEEERSSEGVKAWDVGSLIDMSGGSTVDLLKVDIERSELAVFGESAGSWLHRVRNICIELHGADCEKVFFAALKKFDFELGYSGELTLCRNLRPQKMA